MDQFTKWNGLFRQITMLGQFGVSLVTPLLMCLIACYFLCSRAGLGSWIYIPGFILGIGASAVTAYKFYLSVLKKEEGKRHTTGTAFNRHR